LDPRLDDIDGGEGTVGDGTTQRTGKGEPRVKVSTGRRGLNSVLPGLLGILYFQVCLVEQLLSLCFGFTTVSFALSDSIVDLVSYGGSEEGAGGGEERVDTGHD